METKAGEQGEAKPTDAPSLREHGGAVMAESLARMLSYAEGVRQAEDTEAVHQMRVWSRHARAALEVFGCCFHSGTFTLMEREVKAMADALGEARDLDVMIETLGKRADALPPEQRPGIDAFIERLRRQRRAGQEHVLKALARLERHDLAGQFDGLRRQRGVKKAASARSGRKGRKRSRG